MVTNHISSNLEQVSSESILGLIFFEKFVNLTANMNENAKNVKTIK